MKKSIKWFVIIGTCILLSACSGNETTKEKQSNNASKETVAENQSNDDAEESKETVTGNESNNATEESKETAVESQPNNSVEEKEETVDLNDKINVEVKVTPVLTSNGRMIIQGTTNIPDGAELMISIENESIDYLGQDKQIVSDGKFESVEASYHNQPFPTGTYLITVTMPVANVQSPSFISKVGENYERLEGSLMVESSIGGRIMSYETSFDVK